MTIAAVIPARSGSRRLPHKNVALFHGVPLLVHKIRQLKELERAGLLSEIVVSSDSDEYLELAKREGAHGMKRAPELSDEVSVPFGERVARIVSQVEADSILWACCTNPCCTPIHYALGLGMWRFCPGDSLVSFSKVQRFTWNDDGPMNYRMGLAHVASQDLPPYYIPNFAVTIAKRDDMIRWKYFHGPNPAKLFLDPVASIDIDEPHELAMAQAAWTWTKAR